MFAILRSTIVNFMTHQCTQLAAAIAYYMIFSLPGLLLISTNFVAYIARLGAFGGTAEVEERMITEIEEVVGPISSKQIAELIEHAQRIPTSGWGMIAGIAVVLLSASGVVSQVQASLNTIWHAEEESNRLRNRNFLVKRLLSIASVVVVAIVLLLSLILGMAFASLGELAAPFVPASIAPFSSYLTSATTNLLASWLLFTIIYKYLPDVRVTWRDAWRGGLLTAVLFWVGKSVLTSFISHLGIGSAYGAAGSLAVLLAWLYYSALVFLFGAELTQSLEAHFLKVRAKRRHVGG